MFALSGNVSVPIVNKSVHAPTTKNTSLSFGGLPQPSENKDALKIDFIALAKESETQEPVFTGDSYITLAKTESNPNGESSVGNNPFLSKFVSRVSIPQ